MLREIILLLVLTLPTLQAESVLATSGDSSASVSTSGQADVNDLPGTPPTLPQQNGAQGGGSSSVDPNNLPDFSPRPQVMAVRQSNQNGQPSGGSTQNTGSSGSTQDWSFIQGGSNAANTNAKWKTPSSGYKTFPKGWRTTYTIKFNTDCPQNAVNFIFATTGYSFIYLNGELIQSWGEAYPKYHTLTLTKPELKCGCNVIKVVVYNYCCPSPCGLTYSLTQNTDGCYECANTGVSFYNKDTCQCECTNTYACSDQMRSWFDYPTCGCKCTQEFPCGGAKEFSWKTCGCKCKNKCCPEGKVMNDTTCECQCQRKVCGTGYEWDETKCACVPRCFGNCPNLKVWDYNQCKCVCENPSSCTYPRKWN